MTTKTAAVLGFLIGGAIGAGVTYIFMKRKYEPEYEVVYDPTVAASKQVEEPSAPVITESELDQAEKKKQVEEDKKEYEDIVKKYNHQVKKPEPEKKTTKSGGTKKGARKKVDLYLISEEDFSETNLDYDKVCLTYYLADHTLADEMDQMVDDPGRFDEGIRVLLDSTNDENDIYMRDDNTSTDYAIDLAEMSFHVDVLGFSADEDE